MAENNMDLLGWLRKQRGTHLAGWCHFPCAEADALCGAGFRERTGEGVNRRNGYRERPFDPRAGTIALAVPKLRSGSYYLDWLLERRRRAERALVAVVAECYVRGVSTRRVDGLVKTLGIEHISKSQVSEMAKSLDEEVAAFRARPLDAGPCPYLWLDALAVRVREGGRIVRCACVIATAVNADGYREILGYDTFTSEDEAAWRTFLARLTDRGLAGVQLVVSDDHRGLTNAIDALLPGAAHPLHAQRCSAACRRARSRSWRPWCAPSSRSLRPRRSKPSSPG